MRESLDQADLSEKLHTLQKNLGYVGHHMCPHCGKGFMEKDYYSPQSMVNRINLLRARLVEKALNTLKIRDVVAFLKVEKWFIKVCQEKEHQRVEALTRRFEKDMVIEAIDSLSHEEAYIAVKVLAFRGQEVTPDDFPDLPGVTQEQIERAKICVDEIGKRTMNRIIEEIPNGATN